MCSNRAAVTIRYGLVCESTLNCGRIVRWLGRFRPQVAGFDSPGDKTAGGVTVGVAKKLIACGKIPKDSSAVICVTGNGLKTLDAVQGHCGKPREIKPSLREFEALLAHEEKVNA